MRTTELYVFNEDKSRRAVTQAEFIAGRGVKGDVHTNDRAKQVQLVSAEAAEAMKNGRDICCSRFQPNVVLEGFCNEDFAVGDMIEVGDAVLEITRFKTCPSEECEFKGDGECPLRHGAASARVVTSGRVKLA